jgi:hypothetical protein
MATKCFPLIRGRAMRVTRLNACGAVVLGPSSVVASEGFISVALTANTEEGEAISQTNAAGNICVLDTPAPKFTGYGVEVQFCGVDPDLYALMTGQPVVVDGAGDAVGFQVNSDVNLDDSGFALELWSSVPGAACDDSGDPNYGYFLIPFLKGGVIGDFTIENAAINFTLSGAQSKDGNSWDVGPHDVLVDSGSPSPLLEPVPTTNHLHVQVVTLAPPDTDTCGAQALGTADLTATAGTPSTPDSGSYYPTAMTGVTATPSTAWTSGQYAADWKGNKYHWNATAWVAGIA